MIRKMNNFILGFLGVLFIVFSVLFSFYYRDVLQVVDDEVQYTCEPLDLTIYDVTARSMVVEWYTAEKCLGLVKYGTGVDAIHFVALGDDVNVSKNHHSVKLENLQSSMTYYLVIYSDEVNYGSESSPIVVTTYDF